MLSLALQGVLANWSFQENWAAYAIVLTCLSLGIFVALVLNKYVKICLNIFVDTPPPLSMNPLDFQPIHGEVVRFRSFDGTSLRGMHLSTPNRRNVKGMILFCHEYASDMYSCARYARPLIEAGFDVFTFDYRGHGESSSGGGRYRPLQWPSSKELDDTLGACAYLENYLAGEGRSQQIGVFGISRGAGSALLAAASDPNVRAIVCDGAFSTHDTLAGLMKRWAYIFAKVKLVYENHPDWFWRLLLGLMMMRAQPKLGCKYPSVTKAIREMQPRPIFFVHGQKDSYIRQEQAQMLWSLAAQPRYLWVVDGAKHNQAVVTQPRQYSARTIAFFRRHLAGESIDELEITAPAAVVVA